jgi:hypothetical protein
MGMWSSMDPSLSQAWSMGSDVGSSHSALSKRSLGFLLPGLCYVMMHDFPFSQSHRCLSFLAIYYVFIATRLDCLKSSFESVMVLF